LTTVAGEDKEPDSPSNEENGPAALVPTNSQVIRAAKIITAMILTDMEVFFRYSKIYLPP
jgi:hypothetical protein